MSSLATVFMVIGLILFITPPLLWAAVNAQKSRGEVSFKLQRAHKLSWFTAIPLSIVFVAIGFALMML